LAINKREEEPIYVADSGLYYKGKMAQLSEQHILWVSRVPETSQQAQSWISKEPIQWERGEHFYWWEQEVQVGERKERWILVQSDQGLAQHLATAQRQAHQELHEWNRRLGKLTHQEFACQTDACSALDEFKTKLPSWFELEGSLQEHRQYAHAGRPSKHEGPSQSTWTILATLTLIEASVRAFAWNKAKFIIATNVPSSRKSAEEIIQLYKEQTGVERGFGFLKDPLFLASSVFVKKPQRVMATGFIMVLCLLVYRLAEQRIRAQLQTTAQSVPDQLRRPTSSPTLRWVFQCFEGLSIVHVLQDSPVLDSPVTGLTDFHLLILHLLGPIYERFYSLWE
jgi:transposase